MTSRIEIIPVKPSGGLLAFSSLVLLDSFYIGDIAIHSRPDGSLRAVYPDRVLANGRRIQIFHPLTTQAAQVIERPIFSAYSQLLAKRRSTHE